MKYLLLSTTLFFATVNSYCQQLLVPYRVRDKWGYSDTAGKIIIQPRFQGALFFETFEVAKKTFELAEVMLNNKFGLLDRQGKLVVPCAFKQFNIAVGAYCLPVTTTGKAGLYSLPDGKILLDTIYTYISQEGGSFHNYGVFFVTNQEDKVGIYNGNKRQWVAKPGFDAIVAWSKEEVFADKGGKRYVVNLKYNSVKPFIKEAETLSETGIGEGTSLDAAFPVKREEKNPSVRISDITMNGSSPSANMSNRKANETSFDLNQPETIYENGKYGYRFIENFKRERNRHPDPAGNAPDIIHPQYDSIDNRRARNNRLAVKRNGKWGIVDNKNREIIPIQYASFNMQASNAAADVYAIWINRKLSLINDKGDTVIQDCDEIKYKDEYQLLRRGRLFGAYTAGSNDFYKYKFCPTLPRAGWSESYNPLLHVAPGSFPCTLRMDAVLRSSHLYCSVLLNRRRQIKEG